ncbi:MAG: response regulator [Lachnospiraceae bacterium]|nr:response regulator [Lachnospiraceae bacterium]MBP3608801.1 response regulator [Lachnospiraceae bacterium]
MEKYTYEGNNQVLIERFLLVVYTINVSIMIALCVKQYHGIYSSLFMLAGLSVCWILQVGKCRTYEFRALICAVIMQISMILYSIHVGGISRVLPFFMVSIVMMGLYGIENLIYVTTISTVILYVIHAFILKSVSFAEVQERSAVLLQAANIFFMQYIVYIWTKRNREGSRQLLAAIDQLKEVQHSKDDFLANASHEIRTPLNTICGMSELVLKEELPLHIKENVRDIDLAGRNLMTVVRDIMDYSELQSGKMELEEESYNITSTINDVINMAMARRNGKKIDIIVDCDADIPCVMYGDEKKLRRIMMNLLDNAIKFTNAGCVSLGVHFRRESYGVNLIVSIQDTGIGMTAESVEKLFSSFNQVDGSRKRQEGGLGLGLAISNALIKKMGGVFTIKSKLGKGTRVQFSIPQRILIDQPIVSIKNKGILNIATYIDMEQFKMVEIRDEYARVITSMAKHLNEKYHICRNMAELQRRQEKEKFSHIFTSIKEYINNTAYFDKLAEETNVIIILDDRDEKYVTNPKLLKVYKPFYILSIVSVLNGLYDSRDEKHAIASNKFKLEGAHVLVVDDNRTNLRVIEGLLNDYNIKVTTAASGREGLEKVGAADYDFIFMDHMMPEMDGVETMRNIRHMVGTYFQKVPMIALTANAVAGTREALLEEGFTDFLEKPVERSVLERVLKRHIPPEKFIFKEDEAEEHVEAQEENVKEDVTARLRQAGLDVEKGILYCNGKEKLLRVIEGFCEDYEESVKNIEGLFWKENWKEYTIAVHGIKGAMGSIGAISVSEQARQLELAGKENRVDYIVEHHAELMEAYQKLFYALKECIVPEEEVLQQEEEAPVKELPVLEQAVFDHLLDTLENAAYELNHEKMLTVLEELEQFQYQNTALKSLFLPVRRKVEQSDGISAAELAVRLKEKLEGEEEQGNV